MVVQAVSRGALLATTLGLALGVVVVVVVVVVVLTVLVYARWSRRVARDVPAAAWSARCVDASSPRSWRLLTVDDAGIALRGFRGAPVREWRWDQVAGVEASPVQPGAALVAHRGLVLRLTDGTAAKLLFPSASTLRYPPELLDRALAEVRRRLVGPSA